jgi:hypothetical protein
MRIAVLLLCCAVPLLAQRVRVEFDPWTPATGPFPTDWLTVPDEAQKTGRRVNLPLAGCQAPAGDCAELALLNQLDGYHLQPRIRVKFSGAVNPETLRAGVFFVWLETAYARSWPLGRTGDRTPVNQVQWDPATNTMYAKPDAPLEQGRRYAIVVTEAVKDAGGQAVTADEGFDACVARRVGGEYCEAVSRAVAQATGARVAGGSVFTTLSATAWMESAYAATANLTTPFARNASTPAIAASDIQGLIWRQDMRAGADLVDGAVPLPPGALAGAGVGRIAFGTIRSPRFLNARNLIEQRPTGQPVAAPAASEEIFFHVFLPAAPAPAGGYPVVLAGHGLGDSRFGIPTLLALSFASRGWAVVALTAVGHGYGPRGQLRVLTPRGTVDVPAPGRAVDQDGDGNYLAFEGCVVLGPDAPFGIRDCLRQTALDWSAMVRALRAGMDLDGDGRADLSRDQVAYVGQSLGSFYGTLLTAVDASVPVSVLNVGGGSQTESARWSPSLRLLATLYMLVRRPAVLNSGLGFDEQYPLRHQAVEVLTRPGAADVGEVLDRLEWIEAQGAPLSYAPLFYSATPAGSPLKQVLFQMAAGDRVVPNPSNSLLVRAANLQDRAVIYRHDLARQVAPELPDDPHGFLAFLIRDGAAQAIGLAAHAQVVGFVLSGGRQIPDVNAPLRAVFGRDLFVPAEALPEVREYGRK